MREIVVQSFMTLDGVIQAPSGPKDGEEGFHHGGWQDAYRGGDEIIAEWESRTEVLLLGRKTYDIWCGAWAVWDENAPGMMGEFTRRYNRVPKYVASHTLTELPWKNSHLLGDVPGEVRALREQPGTGEIRVWGSTVLIRTLAEHDLIDEYRIITYPLVLGSGTKLFPEGFPLSRLALVSSQPLDSGAVIHTYRRAGEKS